MKKVLYFSAMLMVAGVGTGVSADIISVSLTYTNSAGSVLNLLQKKVMVFPV